MMAEPGASVSLKSFNKWSFKDDFEFKAEQGQVLNDYYGTANSGGEQQ